VHLLLHIYGHQLSLHASHVFCYVETKRPELAELLRLVTPRYAAYWKEIGMCLGIESGQLDIIKLNNVADANRSCNDLWKKWLMIDMDATWEKLFKAIDSAIASLGLSGAYAG